MRDDRLASNGGDHVLTIPTAARSVPRVIPRWSSHGASTSLPGTPQRHRCVHGSSPSEAQRFTEATCMWSAAGTGRPGCGPPSGTRSGSRWSRSATLASSMSQHRGRDGRFSYRRPVSTEVVDGGEKVASKNSRCVPPARRRSPPRSSSSRRPGRTPGVPSECRDAPGYLVTVSGGGEHAVYGGCSSTTDDVRDDVPGVLRGRRELNHQAGRACGRRGLGRRPAGPPVPRRETRESDLRLNRLARRFTIDQTVALMDHQSLLVVVT